MTTIQYEELIEKLKTLHVSKKKIKQQQEDSSIRFKVVFKLHQELNNEKKSKNIEISIYNYTINYIRHNKIIEIYKLHKKNKRKIVNNNEISWNNDRFKRIYLAKARSILFNLKNENNPTFKTNVINNIISSRNIVNLKPEEIYPEIWEDTFQRILNKEMIRIKNEGKELEEAHEGQYECRKCKCKKVSYYELQTRSADEPMTVYFTCLNCQNHWKE